MNRDEMLEHLIRSRFQLEEALKHLKEAEKYLINQYLKRGERGGEGNP